MAHATSPGAGITNAPTATVAPARIAHLCGPEGCGHAIGTVMSLPRDLIRTIGHLKTTSALAPLSMPGGLIGLFAVLITIVAGPHHLLTYILWIFFILWFAAIGGAYIYWSIKDPDRLQTENYQLEQRRITLLGDERNPGKVIEGIPLTANTAAPMVAGKQ